MSAAMYIYNNPIVTQETVDSMANLLLATIAGFVPNQPTAAVIYLDTLVSSMEEY